MKPREKACGAALTAHGCRDHVVPRSSMCPHSRCCQRSCTLLSLLLLQSVQARTQARIRLLHLLSNVHTITPALGGIVGALSESVPSTSRIIAAIVQNQLLTQLPSISPRSESSWKSEARDVACMAGSCTPCSW